MLSSSGFRDALGERDLRFNRESGQVHERLFLRPELAAYESALRRRVGRLASLEDPRLVVVEALEHDSDTRRVAVISRHFSGLRLQEVLRRARERELVPDLTVSLYLTAELMLAAHSFQALAGFPHGAITPGRVIIGREGEVLLADYAYAEALEAARFTQTRLWREFGIAAWLGEPFSFAGDVRQCALVGIALMLGRPLADDAAERLETLLSEVQEVAMIRGGRLVADPVITWLRRAVAAGGPDGFEAAEDAAQACVALLTERERAAAPAAFLQFLAELDTPPTTAVPVNLASAVGAEEHEAFQGPGPEFLPITESEPLIDDALPLPKDDLMGVPSFELEIPEGLRIDPAVVAPAEAAPAPDPRQWTPTTTPAFDASHDTGPRVSSPSPFDIASKVPSTPAGLEPPGLPSPIDTSAAVSEVVAPPIAAPLPPDVKAALAPAAPAPFLPATTHGPIRLKTPDTPVRSKPGHSSKRDRSTSLHLNDRPEPEPDQIEEEVSAGWHVPWKYVAVAVVVLASGLAAATVDWSSKPAAPAEVAKPVEAPPPPPPITGSIEVVSNTPGAKVLVDGKVRGETPLTIGELKPGRHTVVVRASNGNVRRTVVVKVGETTKIDLAVYSGWVVVNAPVELQILESGKQIGTAGEGPIVLAAGHHTIEVANQALDYRSTHEVDIQPGEEQRLDLNPKGLANLNAVPWAEVWLDGTKIGDTPLGNVAVPLGTREFVFKNPQFGERKISTTITGTAPATVSVDFTK